MRLPLVARSLLSGALVYVLASACAATSHQVSPSAEDADGDRSPADVVRDAVADVVAEIGTPVHDAKADEAADVAVEPCTTVLKMDGYDTYFAVHSYPGKTRTDLANLHVLVGSSRVEGYTDGLGSAAWVRDGSAAVYCGLVSAGPSSTKITFVLP